MGWPSGPRRTRGQFARLQHSRLRRRREDDLELCGSVAEQGETGADDLPVFIAVAGRGQGTDSGESGFEAGDGGELCDEFEDLSLLLLADRREIPGACRSACGTALFGEEKFSEAEVGLVRLLRVLSEFGEVA